MSSVDVVVPCYRYGRFLRQCVESALSQVGVKVRVLVIDDCSPDHTEEVATALCRESPGVTFIRHAVNRGHIATYNEGIDWASAKYYMILSADDYLLPGALGRTASLMDANPNVGLAFGQAVTLEEGESHDSSTAGSPAPDWQIVTGANFIKSCGARNCVPTPAAVVRTEIQKRIGGYRPELPHSGDMEMWLRLAAHSDIGTSAVEHAVYRRHSGNMSLAYTTRSWLPDLVQRKAALDCFLDTCGGSLNEAKEMHARAVRLLSVEAVRFASGAFNNGEIELSRQISAFALEIYPAIRRSSPWTKLVCKRYLGVEAWRSLRAPVARMRKMGNARQ